VARIDDEAAAQRLSRNEYLRRSFEQGVQSGHASAVTLSDRHGATEAARELSPATSCEGWQFDRVRALAIALS
jgi:hypothetical protein